VQVADANGTITFKSIYPGCYSGRWPHIHYEVYASVADATNGSNKVATSQLALDKDVSTAVYASALYPQSAGNLSRITLASDNVFSDGADRETPVITGNLTDGYAMALTVPVAL
jgi:protocatechuate 3,4-dioxygenase beta subunit